MYQTEDLLRVYDFNLDSIDEFVIRHLPVTDVEKNEFRQWYIEIADEMVKEGIKQHGHLSRVQDHVFALRDLHEKLLSENTEYRKVYDEAEPHINYHINLSEGKIDNPIQICINGVYGLLLLRLNGKQIEDEIMERLDHFGNVLSFLAGNYKNQSIN